MKQVQNINEKLNQSPESFMRQSLRKLIRAFKPNSTDLNYSSWNRLENRNLNENQEFHFSDSKSQLFDRRFM